MPELNLPVPGVTPGPQWASSLNSAIQTVNTVADAALPNNSASRTQLAGSPELISGLGSVFGIVPISQFLNEGESLTLDGTGNGQLNTTVLQRYADWAEARLAATGKSSKVQFPEGSKVKLYRAGVEPLSSAGYSVRWKSGAGIATNGDPNGLVFISSSAATPFFAAKSFGGISDVYVDAHTVDGSPQTNSTYTTVLKGWFVQDMQRARFRDVLIVNTWATGYGCDFLRDVIVTGVARGCGRGIKEKGIDPLTTSGGSGFGIGTGLYEVEDFTLDVAAYDCGFHGVFTETQVLYRTAGDIHYPFTKGSRIRAYVERNHVGFRDCGSDGLVSDITASANTYADVLHDATVLAPSAGTNGVCRAVMDGRGIGAVGLLLGVCGAGGYSFDVQSTGHTGHGITTKAGGSLGRRLRLRGRSFANGGKGVSIALSSQDIDLDVTTWGNALGGLSMPGGSLTAVAPRVGGDYRADGAVVEHAITGDFRIDARGLSATAPYGVTVAPSGSTGLAVSWAAPLIPDGVTDYAIRYRKVGDSAWTTFTHTASTATAQTITGLDVGDFYEVGVAAVTAAGTGGYVSGFGATGALRMGDTFNRADTSGVGLGTMDSGSNPASWSGGLAWNILSNRAYSSSTNPIPLTTIDTGVVARAIEFTLTAFGSGTSQVYVRGTATGANVSADRNAAGWRLLKNGNTVLLTTDAVPAVGDTVRVVCLTGGVYRMYVNGQFKGTVTDAQSATDTNAGLRAASPTSFDNFKVFS